MLRMVRLGLGCAMVAALGLLMPLTALAHEHRDVGQYSFVVGFLDEPAFAGEKNGLDLRVTSESSATPTASDDEEAAGTPVEGLESTLKVEVIYGDQKMDLTLEPAFRNPGAYQAYFFPMAVGDYSFHIYGDIQGTAIDETFTSSPDGFSSVEDPAPLQFPKQTGSKSGVVTGTIGGGDDIGGGSGGLLAAVGLGALIGVAGLALVARRQTARRAPDALPVPVSV